MSRFLPLPRAFYRRPADTVAAELLGRYVVRSWRRRRLVLRIVETEAYLGASDRASHAWGDRRTPRTRSLFQDGGRAYVYLIYGVYHMLNAVTGSADDGTAVLIRAGEPLEGDDAMKRLRGLGGEVRPGQIAGGPGRLCQALAIDRRLDRCSLQRGPLRLTRGEGVAPQARVVGPRVGVDYAGEHARWPLRFAVAGDPHVSRPLPPD